MPPPAIVELRTTSISLLIFLVLYVSPSIAQVPTGYEVIQLADDPGGHSRPSIDINGDVVWSSAFPQEEMSEIYRYHGGRVDLLTQGNGYHVYPQISTHSGMIAWRLCEGFSANSCQAAIFDGNTQVHIATAFTVDENVAVNDDGHIVWAHDFSGDGTHLELFYYDGVRVSQLTKNGLSNQNPRINNSNEIVWTRFDFSKSPSQSTIMLHSGEQQLELSDDTLLPGGQDINDIGQVVWGSASDGIELWEGGVTTVVTSDGRAPRINNKGEIAFTRFDNSINRWAIWLYKQNNFRRLSDPMHSCSEADINDDAEVTWHCFVNTTTGQTGVFLLKRITGIPAVSARGVLVLAGATCILAAVFIGRGVPRFCKKRSSNTRGDDTVKIARLT